MARVRDHWPLHARQWALVGPPLRPCAEDVRAVASAIGSRPPPSRALLLGVTPELASLAWPAGTSLVAADRSADMIGAIFPGPSERGRAIQADWRALPFADGSFDVAVGDGCLSNLPYPDGYHGFAREVGRVLAPGGVLVLRLFAAPERAESLDDVARDLRDGRIGSFHALKWRLAMAVQPPDRNVPVEEILRALDRVAPDRARLPWPADVVGTIEAYRGSPLVYSFPTLAEARRAMSGHLAERAIVTPGYELGDRCPIVTLTARDPARP
jgi:SAM-dependent methyltransferase